MRPNLKYLLELIKNIYVITLHFKSGLKVMCYVICSLESCGVKCSLREVLQITVPVKNSVDLGLKESFDCALWLEKCIHVFMYNSKSCFQIGRFFHYETFSVVVATVYFVGRCCFIIKYLHLCFGKAFSTY